ncbi:PAH2 domain-containing protein [Backusella circina FSU 941]|nr:PAH2 domain-containing protein [Backusella circina FSU 941]
MKEKLSETKQEAKNLDVKDAVGYLEQVKSSYENEPQIYSHFLDIMNDFRSEKINTSQVLERVTLLFRGKPYLIRNFLMFLPPGHVLDVSPEDKPHLTCIATPSGGRIIINIDEATVKYE